MYKEYEVLIHDERNFTLKHMDDSKGIEPTQVSLVESDNGVLEWIGLPPILECQLSVFNREEVAQYPGTLLKVIIS